MPTVEEYQKFVNSILMQNLQNIPAEQVAAIYSVRGSAKSEDTKKRRPITPEDLATHRAIVESLLN